MATGAGGKREGSGRKSKSDELKLIEKLTPYHDKAIALLFKKIDEEDMNALKMFMEYAHGKPKQQIDQKNTHELLEDFDITKLYAKNKEA